MNRLTRLCSAGLIAACALAPLSGRADVVVLDEGFGNVANLPGWDQLDYSDPTSTGWFQGYTDVFGAQAGPGNSYAASNFLGADGSTGRVDNWLITPILALSGVTNLSFYTNREDNPGLTDLLEVRFATGNGGIAEDFDYLLLFSIGGDGFPAQWTQWSTSLAFEGEGRFAFRYSGEADTLGYVGLDSVRVVTAVPEPSSYLLMLGGLGVLGATVRRGRRPAQAEPELKA